MNKTFFSLLLLLTMGVSSCDMPLADDYYQSITEDDNIGVSIVFNTNWDKGTMMLTGQNTQVIPYSISAYGKEIVVVEMTMGSMKWTLNEAHGELVVYNSELPDGKYTLSCEIYIKGNSGSLANQLDAEYYGGTFSFPVQINRQAEAPKRMRKSINKDGFLAFDWDMPEVSHLEIVDYTLYYNENGIHRTKTIAATEHIAVDNEYAGEACKYELRANLKDSYTGDRFSWLVDSYDMEESINLSYRHLDDGRIMLEWNNPYPHKVKIEQMSILQDAELKNGSLTFTPQPLNNTYWDINQMINISMSNTVNTDQYFWKREITIPLYADCVTDDKFAYFDYNPADNTIYAVTQNELIAVNPYDYRLTKKHDLNTYYASEICTSPNSAMVVAYVPYFNNVNDNDYLVAYRNKDMQEMWRIPCVDKRYNGTKAKQMFLTTDDKLIYFASRSTGNHAVVINALTGAIEKDIKLDADSYVYEKAISPDGKNICYNDAHNTYIIELENYEMKAKHILFSDNYLRNCYFAYNRPNEIITITSDNSDITYWDLTTREKIRSITPVDHSSLIAMDSYTGNLLLLNYPKLYVASPVDGSILFETNTKSRSCSLVNNHLNSYDGLLLNLNKYMTK